MKKSLILALVLATLVGCKQHSKFYVEGKVAGAEGRMLYLEHNAITGNTVLDSTKLGSGGSFSFNAARPLYPDFYRLRLGDTYITFGIDSCETLSFEANADNFPTDYTVKGSIESEQIRKLRISLIRIQDKVNKLSDTIPATERAVIIAGVEKDIATHKAMARKLILENPRSLTSYFAIYQQINNIYLFTPYLKEDKPYCAAVATSYNTFMPEYIRSKNLYNYVIQAIKLERKQQEKQAWNQILANADIGYINIELPDKNDVLTKLSSFEGRLILIDFSVYEVKENVDYTFALRDLYSKYHNRGFEIYQISLDRNKAFWQQAVQNIPWVCVRDENGPESKYAATYNVSSVPTLFLLNRKGVIIGRYNNLAQAVKVIDKNL